MLVLPSSRRSPTSSSFSVLCGTLQGNELAAQDTRQEYEGVRAVDSVEHLLAETAHVIDLFGIAIVLYGFVIAGIGFVRAEIRRLLKGGSMEACHRVRIQLGTYILTGIEFMIASDIINTVLTRELMDLAFVAALVLIRSAISFFLAREVHDLREEG